MAMAPEDKVAGRVEWSSPVGAEVGKGCKILNKSKEFDAQERTPSKAIETYATAPSPSCVAVAGSPDRVIPPGRRVLVPG